MNTTKTKVAVIGAGLSGLNVANLLSEIAEVTIYEKSNKLGGRIATRTSQGFSFDHGTQFFTANTQEFKTFVHAMQSVAMVAQWDANFVEI